MTSRPHSILRRLTLCLFGHRPGETWFRVTKGKRPERVDCCSRCGCSPSPRRFVA